MAADARLRESRPAETRHYLPYLALGLVFGLSRWICYSGGVRFDPRSITYYLQYIDPPLLKSSLWESLFYLKEQPPLFNLFLGIVLKLVPDQDLAPVFHAFFLSCGAILALTLLSLLRRMGVSKGLSFLIAFVFTISPVTILYENWLFYAYPLVMLFCLATLMLHRFLSSRRRADAIFFFSILGLIPAIRGTYHFLWFVLIAGALVWLLPSQKRVLLGAMALPGLLLLSIYIKNVFVSGNILGGGDVLQAMNAVKMTTDFLPPSVLPSVVAQGKVSPILTRAFNLLPASAREFRQFVPEPPPTGVALLDRPFKTGGGMNLNARWMSELARAYAPGTRFLMLHYPGALGRHILSNLKNYFTLGGEAVTFEGATNARALERPLRFYHKVAGKPWFVPVVYVLILCFGLIQATVWMVRRQSDPTATEDPRKIVILFAIFNIVYAGAVTVLFSFGDHNRYRTEIAALYAVLGGLLLESFWGILRRRLEKVGRLAPPWVHTGRMPLFGAALVASFIVMSPNPRPLKPDGATPKLAYSAAPGLYNLEMVQDIDYPTNPQPPWNRQPVPISRFAYLYVAGWAVDDASKAGASGVDVVIDGKAYRAQAGETRDDVAAYFHVPAYANAGFELELIASAIGRGKHELAIRVISHDGTRYSESPSLTIEVR